MNRINSVVFLFSAVFAADTRVAFTSVNDVAQTSITADFPFTTLYVTKQPKGAQILYKQLVKEPMLAPLVTVYLVNPSLGLEVPIQSGFDTVSQACSCYWIDSATIIAKKLPSSKKWRLAFKGAARGSVAAMNEVSGEFGLSWENEVKEGFVGTYEAPEVKPVVINGLSADELNRAREARDNAAAPKPTSPLTVNANGSSNKTVADNTNVAATSGKTSDASISGASLMSLVVALTMAFAL